MGTTEIVFWYIKLCVNRICEYVFLRLDGYLFRYDYQVLFYND